MRRKLIFTADQTSSQLHKTVIDYDYDYFQFMKDDYDYTVIFARGSTITILTIYFLNSTLRLHLECDYKFPI